jgi:hypothetical protein
LKVPCEHLVKRDKPLRKFEKLALGAGLLASLASPAFGKSARCEIKTSDGGYSGPCIFVAGAGGIFSISPSAKSEFFSHGAADPGITDISVYVAGSTAEVRGLTTEGINSRWGSAKRSQKDKACWIGVDFSICVY